MHPIGICLMGVHLIGVCLMGVYLTDMHLIGIPYGHASQGHMFHRYASHKYTPRERVSHACVSRVSHACVSCVCLMRVSHRHSSQGNILHGHASYGSQSAKTPTASSRSSELAPELARPRQTELNAGALRSSEPSIKLPVS
jgi:hypothetical protein